MSQIKFFVALSGMSLVDANQLVVSRIDRKEAAYRQSVNIKQSTCALTSTVKHLGEIISNQSNQK